MHITLYWLWFFTLGKVRGRHPHTLRVERFVGSCSDTRRLRSRAHLRFSAPAFISGACGRVTLCRSLRPMITLTSGSHGHCQGRTVVCTAGVKCLCAESEGHLLAPSRCGQPFCQDFAYRCLYAILKRLLRVL